MSPSAKAFSGAAGTIGSASARWTGGNTAHASGDAVGADGPTDSGGPLGAVDGGSGAARRRNPSRTVSRNPVHHDIRPTADS